MKWEENYFKLKLKVKNSSYDKWSQEKPTIRYKGSMYVVFDKTTNYMVYNTIILDENQEMWGVASDNDKDLSYFLNKSEYKELKNYKNMCLPLKGEYNKEKPKVKFVCSLSEMNNMIIRNKLTAKNFHGFMCDTKPSGGLDTPQRDPLDVIIENDLECVYGDDILSGEKKMKITSLISNITKKHRNQRFKNNLSIEDLESIEEMKLAEFIEMRDSDGNYVFEVNTSSKIKLPFKYALPPQNKNLFMDSGKYSSHLADPEFIKGPTDPISNLVKTINKRNYDLLKSELRSYWESNVEQDKEDKSFMKDFLLGQDSFQRAHIIENAVSARKLLHDDLSLDEKKNIIDDLISKENYVLLRSDIHNDWDKNKIWIDENGTIHNEMLSQDRFDEITRLHSNIFDIYSNARTKKRIELLIKRLSM